MKDKKYYKKSHFHEEGHKLPKRKQLHDLIQRELEEELKLGWDEADLAAEWYPLTEIIGADDV
jgi:hypothetical protein